MRPLRWPAQLPAVALIATALVAAQPRAQDSISLSELGQATHFHGLAVNPQTPQELFLATHHGFFILGMDGTARRMSEDSNDYMGFTPHPTDASVLYASGHPAGGGNMGFMTSTDGGRTWSQIAPGANGPVDFHQMDVSKADPQRIYGIYGELQVSKDGGKTWEALVGHTPPGVIDLAASAKDADTLYAATEGGLLRSTDMGATWQPAFATTATASLVQTAADGALYAFIGGVGLVRTSEPDLNWTTLSNDFADRWMIHLAVDPTDPMNMYAVMHKGEMIASKDGGRTWSPFPQP